MQIIKLYGSLYAASYLHKNLALTGSICFWNTVGVSLLKDNWLAMWKQSYLKQLISFHKQKPCCHLTYLGIWCHAPEANNYLTTTIDDTIFFVFIIKLSHWIYLICGIQGSIDLFTTLSPHSSTPNLGPHLYSTPKWPSHLTFLFCCWWYSGVSGDPPLRLPYFRA